MNQELLQEHISVFKILSKYKKEYLTLSKLVTNVVKKGNKIIVCGNGGSATEAQHFVAELIGTFISNRKPVPAICINSDQSIITALSNDFGYENIFIRQVDALMNKNDLLVLLSTSGNSKNLVNVAKHAKKKKFKVISLTGKNKSDLSKLSDFTFFAPSYKTSIIQEVHLFLIHAICYDIEKIFK